VANLIGPAEKKRHMEQSLHTISTPSASTLHTRQRPPGALGRADSNGDRNSSDRRQAAAAGDSTKHSHDPWQLGICPDWKAEAAVQLACT
jgi:hypothetical protein